MKSVQGEVLLEECGRANLEDFLLFMCLLYQHGGGEIDLPAKLVSSVVATILGAAVSFLDPFHCNKMCSDGVSQTMIDSASASTSLVFSLCTNPSPEKERMSIGMVSIFTVSSKLWTWAKCMSFLVPTSPFKLAELQCADIRTG